MIDRFVEANLHFWEDVQAFLIRRQPSNEVARTRFSYDRGALLEGIAGSARQHLETTTEQELARGHDPSSFLLAATRSWADGQTLRATPT